MLTSPLRDRFGIVERLDHYPVNELALIVERFTKLLRPKISKDATDEIGCPPVARQGLPIACYAECATLPRSKVMVWLPTRLPALRWTAWMSIVLALMRWRKYLLTIIDKFDGGPVGIETLCASLSEERDTLEEVYEPYLLQEGFIQRTARGRVATSRAMAHLHKSVPRKPGTLF